MLIVKIKICGITNYEDAIAAVEMGADLLGFNFYPKSLRYIEPEEALKIIKKLPAFVETAGVFVNAAYEQIREIKQLCMLNWVQFHGEEEPAFCERFFPLNVKTMKALRIRDKKDIEQVNDYSTDAILLDAYDPAKYGGAGITFDWNVIGHINKRIFLAGGINPDNAAKAIELGVYGIDICSGIESKPGKKDHKKMKRLFDNIKYLRG
jgi:phosphoribosylanthranilate isomerase